MKRLAAALLIVCIFLTGCGHANKAVNVEYTEDDAQCDEAPMQAAVSNTAQEISAALGKGKRSISISAQTTVLVPSEEDETQNLYRAAKQQTSALKFSDTSNPVVEEQINTTLASCFASLEHGVEATALQKNDGAEVDVELYQYSYFESYDVTCLNQNFLSLMIYTNAFYDSSNASDSKSGITFELSTGKQLKLEELLLEGGMEALSEIALEQLVSFTNYFQSDADSQNIVDRYFERLSDAEKTGFTVPWCLSDDGLLLFLSGNPADNTLGTQTILLRYSVLDGILKPMYLPRESSYSGVTLRVDCGEEISVDDFENVDFLYIDDSQNFIVISTDTVLPNLRISQVLWINDQAVEQSDLYAADIMTPLDAVCVEIAMQDVSSGIQLQYTSDDGVKTVYLSMGADEELVMMNGAGES